MRRRDPRPARMVSFVRDGLRRRLLRAASHGAGVRAGGDGAADRDGRALARRWRSGRRRGGRQRWRVRSRVRGGRVVARGRDDRRVLRGTCLRERSQPGRHDRREHEPRGGGGLSAGRAEDRVPGCASFPGQRGAVGRPGGDRGDRRRPLAAESKVAPGSDRDGDRKSTRLNSSHITISYAVFCLKKKKKKKTKKTRTNTIHNTKKIRSIVTQITN